jgi:hypothetical protein
MRIARRGGWGGLGGGRGSGGAIGGRMGGQGPGTVLKQCIVGSPRKEASGRNSSKKHNS